MTSGKELFGNHTLPGVSNGFEALRILTMQTNGGVSRGSVSTEDPIFSQLLLWHDANHNGMSESGGLRPASELVSDIGLGYQVLPRRDGHGNLFRLRGWVHVRTKNGRNQVATKRENELRTRFVWDVFFVIQR